MAAPMLTMASVLAIRFKPCFHNKNGLNFITSIPNSKLVEDIYHQYHDKSDKTVKVIIQCSTEMTPTSSSLFDVEGGMSVGTLVRNFGIKLVEFTCNQKTTDAPSTSLEACAKEATEKAVDAFQLMMAGGRRFAAKKTTSQGMKTGLSKKDELYNNLVDDFMRKGLDFPRGTEAMEGSYIVQVLCNALWYATNLIAKPD